MNGLVRFRSGACAGNRSASLQEQGQLRLLGPRREVDAVAYTLVNTSGAILGGDRLRVCINVSAPAVVRIDTVGATLLHAGRCSFARTDLTVGAGAALAWLPGSLIPMAGAQHRQQLRINVATGGTLLAAEILMASTLAGDCDDPAHLTTTVLAHFDSEAVYRERVGYLSGGAAAWGEFRCLGSLVALGRQYDEGAATAVTNLWSKHRVWGAMGALVRGGISGKILARHPQDCRNAMAAAVAFLRPVGSARPTETPQSWPETPALLPH